jgi:3-oxoadipate enol-lactonase
MSTDAGVRRAGGATLHVQEAAGARPALLLHGLGYASWASGALAGRVAPELALHSLDNRGTGESPRGTGHLTIERLAEDAAAVIEALGAPAVVVGYSMGGYIAQVLAVAHPELVAGLVLVGTSPGGDVATPVPETTKQAWMDAAGSPPAEHAARTMPLSFRDGWPEAHPDEYGRLLDARLRHPTSPSVWREQFDACEEFLRSGYDRSRLTAPALVLHGTADRVVPVENGRALHALLPHSTYREVAGAGHLLHLEEPDLVAAEIRAFISASLAAPEKKEN